MLYYSLEAGNPVINNLADNCSSKDLEQSESENDDFENFENEENVDEVAEVIKSKVASDSKNRQSRQSEYTKKKSIIKRVSFKNSLWQINFYFFKL